MSKVTGSTATVAPGNIIASCNTWLSKREKRVEAKREALVVAEMAKKRWFREPITREEALANLKADSNYDSQWRRCSWEGGYWVSEMENLLKLAEIAQREGGQVTISSELADLVLENL